MYFEHIYFLLPPSSLSLSSSFPSSPSVFIIRRVYVHIKKTRFLHMRWSLIPSILLQMIPYCYSTWLTKFYYDYIADFIYYFISWWIPCLISHRVSENSAIPDTDRLASPCCAASPPFVYLPSSSVTGSWSRSSFSFLHKAPIVP